MAVDGEKKKILQGLSEESFLEAKPRKQEQECCHNAQAKHIAAKSHHTGNGNSYQHPQKEKETDRAHVKCWANPGN